MAVIRTVRDWNGLTVVEYTDTSTGIIELRSQGTLGQNAPLLATSEGSTWTYGNQQLFRDIYNQAQRNNNQQTLSQQEFNKEFFTEGYQLFNEDRAEVLNDTDNYESVEVAEHNQQAFFTTGVPGLESPVTGQTVNNDGSTTTEQTVAEQEQPQEEGDDEVNQSTTSTTSDSSTEPNTNSTQNADTVTVGGTQELLQYPLYDPPPGLEYDYIQIKAYDYNPSGLGFSNKDADVNLGNTSYETIQLPMQPKITETNAVNWADDSLNPIKATLGKFAASTIGAVGNFSADELGKAFTNLGDDIKKGLNDPALKPFIAAYFAGQAVGANIQGRSTGQVVNPNLELLFNGPTLRTFNFNFRMTPRSRDESEQIRKIIRAFKRNMLASRSEQGLFLKSPRVFKLEYIYKQGGQHPYLNKFKPCALTNFQVDYTPDNTYMTFDSTGSLTSYDLTLAFSELQPNYADEIGDSPTDMGY